MPAAPLWQLDGSVAKLSVASSIAASIDVTRPSRGLQWLSDRSAADPCNILGVVLGGKEPMDSAGIDVFARGRDLVATYAEQPPRHVRAQVYWRCLTPEEFAPDHASSIVAAFDLILSVNTSVLDEDPQSTVHSSVSCPTEILNAGKTPGCFLVRTRDSNQSYVEMVHPIDYQQSEASSGERQAQIVHRLFAQRLEKGVILRARIRGAVIACERDEATAIAGFQCFSAAEPPLTV
jgi:hypothetical protein